MNRKLDFLVYCIENYKNTYGFKGKETIDLFNRFNVLEYIETSYEALHTTGKEYIIDDINGYIDARKFK